MLRKLSLFLALDNTFERENSIALQKLIHYVTFKKTKIKPLMFKIIKNTAILFLVGLSTVIGVL